MNQKQKTQLQRDLEWLATFDVGSRWMTGAFRPKREAELVRLGALIPVEGEPGVFVLGQPK